LELGSTAKLRTLTSYLMAIDEIDSNLKSSGDDLQGSEQQDPLSKWVSEYRLFHPDVTREEVLKASLLRSISASPYQAFFTGGGLHTFKNFKEEQDTQSFTIEEGFRQSINLVFIRLMKEVVDYHVSHLGYHPEILLSDTKNPQRMVLLREAAAQEATGFLRKYYRLHFSRPHGESVSILSQSYQHPLRNWVLLFLKNNPTTTLEQLKEAARNHFHFIDDLTRVSLEKLYKAYRGKSYNLTDEAYLLGKHPLEVWMVFYLRDHPKASWDKVLEDSKEAREISSAWLFKTRFFNAQNIRIRTLIEKKAFEEIHRSWKALGYPFDALVPSLATAIGSSADRPVSLAELVGIILNNGIRKPLVRIKELHFGEDTPYETHYASPPSSAEKRVMSSEVARVLQYALRQVVEKGTAQRINNTYVDLDGKPLAIGGKTGTGDNRFETFRRGGVLVSSKILSRTSTFVFFLDRFFGIVTAHVEGPEASEYEFTSALAVQVLKTLQPALGPLLRSQALPTTGGDLHATGH
jgi:membrane peptidoglycan carboxypeptidase